ncbi:MAG TPA: hypothetical protein VIK86_00965 [Candidatus Paceibacterota bacterium]
MKLNEWVEDKKSELLENKTYKSVEFARVDKIKISSNMTSQCFNIGMADEKINMDIEVENFERNKIVGEIAGVEITFNVIKPRCRKPERLRLCVKIS